MKKIMVFLSCVIMLLCTSCSCQVTTYDFNEHFSEQELLEIQYHLSRLVTVDPEHAIPIIAHLIDTQNASFLISDLINKLEIRQNAESIPIFWDDIALLLARMGKEAKDALPALCDCRQFTKECMIKYEDIAVQAVNYEYYLACFDIAITSIMHDKFDINYQNQQVQIAWLKYAIRLIEWNYIHDMKDGTEDALNFISWNIPVEFHWDEMNELLYTLMLLVRKNEETYFCEIALRNLGKLGANAESILPGLEVRRTDFHDDFYIMPIIDETIDKIKMACKKNEKKY